MANTETRQLTELTSVLGRSFNAARGPADQVARAVLARGYQEGLTTDEVRLYLRVRAASWRPRGATPSRPSEGVRAAGTAVVARAADNYGEGLRALLDNAAVWSDLCDQVRQKVDRSSSLSGDDALEARWVLASKLVARLLLPFPDRDGERPGFTKNVNLRAMFTDLALAQLDGDPRFDSVYRSQPRMAVDLGWSRRTAARSLIDLEAMNLITHPAAGRYRIRAVPPARLAKTDRYVETINAIAFGTPDPVADVIRSLRHPSWSYGSTIGHGHWAVLLMQTADINPDILSWSSSTRRRIIQELQTAQLNAATLITTLDRLARSAADGVDGVPAIERHSAAQQEWRTNADARKSEAAWFTRVKSAAFQATERLFTAYPLPKPAPRSGAGARPKSELELETWQRIVSTTVGSDIGEQPSEFWRQFHAACARRISRRGYGPRSALIIATSIIPVAHRPADQESQPGDRRQIGP